MKLSIIKSAVSFVLTISVTCIALSNAYADAYIRPASSGDIYWYSYSGKFDRPPLFFAALNDEAHFDNALFMASPFWKDRSYVGLPGEYKRFGVFKLQKSNPRKDLILPSKNEAVTFCNRLIIAAHGIDDKVVLDGQTVFVSNWWNGDKQAIAVAYRVAYDGEYGGKLTAAKKYLICPNPFGVQLDFSVQDENELIGIRASALGNSDVYNSDTDINGRYHVVCMDPTMPETDFIWNMGTSHNWSNGIYWYTGNRSSVLENIDTTLGAAYCAGQLEKIRR